MKYVPRPIRWLISLALSAASTALVSAAIPPLDIQIVSKSDLPGSIAGPSGVLSGDFLFLNNMGLAVLNIHDPAAPKSIAQLPDGFGFAGPVISGNTLFQINDSHLSIFDVSNPAAPARIGTLTNFFAYALATYDHYLVAAHNGITILDISNPALPSVIGNLPFQNTGNDLQLAGHYAYTTAPSGAVAVVDLSDPAHPAMVGTIPGTGPSTAMAVDGTHLYIRNHYVYSNGDSFDIEVCDISNPRSPKLIGPLLASRQAALSDTIVLIPGGYVGSSIGTATTLVVSIDQNTNSSVAGVIAPRLPASASQIASTVLAATEHYAYLKIESYSSHGTPSSQLWVADIGTHSQFLPVNQFQSGRIVDLQHDKVTLSTYGDVQNVTTNGFSTEPFAPLVSVDLGNPIGAVSVPTNLAGPLIRGFVDLGSIGAAIDNSQDLVLYDLSNTNKASLLSIIPQERFETPWYDVQGGEAFAAASNSVFVVDTFPLQIGRIDLSNLSNHVLVNHFVSPVTPTPTQRYTALALNGDWLYATLADKLQVFDIHGPTNLTFESEIVLGNLTTKKLIVSGTNLIAVGALSGGFSLYSIASPDAPVFLSQYTNEFSYATAALIGNYLYAAGPDFGIDVFDIHDPTAIVRVGGNSAVTVRQILGNSRYLVTSSLASKAFGSGDSYVFPRFEASPAYTPLASLRDGEDLLIKVHGIPGTTMRLQTSDSLGAWRDWPIVPFGTNSTLAFFFSGLSIGQSNAFFRVVAP